MERNRRQGLLLGLLFVVLAGLLYRSCGPDSPAPVRNRAAPAAAGDGQARAEAVQDVALEKLADERPEMGGEGRNLFKMQPKVVPPPPAPPGPPPGSVPTPSPGTTNTIAPQPVLTGPPPPPPISLKFIGIVTRTQGKLAVLTDGKGVYYGLEGEIVAGQFRIVRIGDESIDLEYPDGRGRQTIRLTGGGA